MKFVQQVIEGFINVDLDKVDISFRLARSERGLEYRVVWIGPEDIRYQVDKESPANYVSIYSSFEVVDMEVTRSQVRPLKIIFVIRNSRHA